MTVPALALSLLICALAASASASAAPLTLGGESLREAPVAHGGGCRKSSLAGQCCHMNHSTGDLHCH